MSKMRPTPCPCGTSFETSTSANNITSFTFLHAHKKALRYDISIPPFSHDDQQKTFLDKIKVLFQKEKSLETFELLEACLWLISTR